MRFRVSGFGFQGACLLCAALALAAPKPQPPLRGQWQGRSARAEDAEVCDRLPDRVVAGDPPASGLRHWAEPFRELPYEVEHQGNSYLSVTHPPSGGIELWANAWGPDHATNRTIFVRRGPAIDRLTSTEILFDGTLIDDVYALDGSGELAPTRGFTRPCMYYAPEDGYVLLCCVCPDYLPGRTYLLPALVVSESGRPGTWRYLGMLKGEPETEAERIREETRRPPRSDGGTLVKLNDGTWRIYLNGFSPTVAALEADALEGPWRFVRDGGGAIRELLPDFPCNGIFPFVLRAAPGAWHLWLTDTWPPQSIWHYASRDGLAWSRFGAQPEITRAAVAGRGIKCLRAYVAPETGSLVGLLAVWGRRRDGACGWLNYMSRMEKGFLLK
ncbi:MAG: hypothetical protein JW951_10310 [Lentisphaerae bacterium]|nr:hypothetical protein [Lentisphaerota bacterium]